MRVCPWNAWAEAALGLEMRESTGAVEFGWLAVKTTGERVSQRRQGNRQHNGSGREERDHPASRHQLEPDAEREEEPDSTAGFAALLVFVLREVRLGVAGEVAA